MDKSFLLKEEKDNNVPKDKIIFAALKAVTSLHILKYCVLFPLVFMSVVFPHCRERERARKRANDENIEKKYKIACMT